MTRYAIPATERPLLPVAASDLHFPVNRIFCVGRNYAAHAVEMGHDPERQPPFFFQKSAENLLPPGMSFDYPADSNEVHHEIELVVALHSGGSRIDSTEANDCIFGYAVGLDLTKRDIQAKAKRAGWPWTASKAFDQSAPCSSLTPVSGLSNGHPNSGKIWLDVSGKRVQEGDLSQMIWKIPQIIQHLSCVVALRPGDLIYTGTPAGVGPIRKGDILNGGIDGIAEIRLEVS